MTDREIDGSADAHAQLWGLWRRLKALFPAWSLIPSSFYTPGAWGYVGVDFLSGFRRNPSTIRSFELLQGVDDATFDALSALANLNVRRQDQMARAVVVGYLVSLAEREVRIDIDLKSGEEEVTVWTNDLTHDYVHENSAYST